MSDDSTIYAIEDNSAIEMTYDELVRHIADTIWQQWQRELRAERERTGRN